MRLVRTYQPDKEAMIAAVLLLLRSEAAPVEAPPAAQSGPQTPGDSVEQTPLLETGRASKRRRSTAA